MTFVLKAQDICHGVSVITVIEYEEWECHQQAYDCHMMGSDLPGISYSFFRGSRFPWQRLTF